jgi:hypothetical protein
MSVIERTCGDVCDASKACGCGVQENVERKGPRIAAATALAAAACTVCCFAPLALPPVVLSLAGGSLAVLDHTHGWATKLAIVVVIAAWAWIAWQVARRQRRMTKATLALMIAATVLTGAASARPLLEPLAFKAFGFEKGAHKDG